MTPKFSITAVTVALVLALAACGSGSSGTDAVASGSEGPRLEGMTRTDPLQVGEIEAIAVDPDGGESPYQFAPDQGRLLYVYFGYTHCPDLCPTTFADFKGALARLDPAEADTEVYLLYDEDAIYVGARMLDDDPQSTFRQLTRRDFTGRVADYFEVSIDSNLDRRSAYTFRVSAAGVQEDRYTYDDTNSDGGWDAVWESGAALTDEGWTAELRIPLSQLRYTPSARPQTWGINFARRRNSAGEKSFWALESRVQHGGVSVYGFLHGIELANATRALELRPYTLVRRETAAAGEASHEGDPPAPVGAGDAAFVKGPIGRLIDAAAAGSVVEVGPGVHREQLRIEKPITLVGRGRPVIDGGGRGDIIEIAAPDVTIRGFVLRNTGTNLDTENTAVRALAPRAVIEDNVLEDILFGIDLREAPESVVRGNRIGGKDLDIARRGDGLRLWRSDNTLIEGNAIHDGRDAIIWYSKGVAVRGNTASDCRYGLHLMFSDDVVIEQNDFSGNSVGIYLMYSAGVEIRRNQLLRNRGPSGYGLGLKETDRFSVVENVFAANRVGVYIDGSPFTTAQPGVFTRNTLA